MPDTVKIQASLTEDHGNFRTREVAHSISLANRGSSRIDILSFAPRVPDGADLSETREFSSQITKEKQAAICKELTASATHPIDVSPSPVALTIVATLSGILGVILKHSIAVVSSTGPVEASGKWKIGAEVLAAVVLAFIVFNVFEFTDLFRQFRNRLNWRHAIFIGVTFGLASERIFQSVIALSGG